MRIFFVFFRWKLIYCVNGSLYFYLVHSLQLTRTFCYHHIPSLFSKFGYTFQLVAKLFNKWWFLIRRLWYDNVYECFLSAGFKWPKRLFPKEAPVPGTRPTPNASQGVNVTKKNSSSLKKRQHKLTCLSLTSLFSLWPVL